MPLDKALRLKWVAAGYDHRMGSTRVRPPPDPKFVPGYHLTSAVHAIKNISLRRMKVARLSDLNDPYELLGPKWPTLEMRAQVQALKTAFDLKIGLLCFSSDWTDPVLWSHYGDKHRGMCLGFDILRSDIRVVNYDLERLADVLPEDSEAANLPGGLEERLFTTKFMNWKYESELRLLVPLRCAIDEGQLHFWPFSDSLVLKEVILGDQCADSVESIREITSSIRPPVVTYRARLAGKSYAVVPDGDTVP